MKVDDPEALDRAEAVLRAGGAVVVPTDTVYGLAVLPGNEDLLYALKDRPADVPIAILVTDAAQAWTLGEPTPAARRLANQHWPGPLTLVIPSRGGAGTVGVRCPDHAFVQALAGRLGPVPTTSANRHGQPTPRTAEEAAAALAGDPALVVDGGRLGDVASTVVDATGDEPRILRQGSLALPG